jgi:hypothetical protein
MTDHAKGTFKVTGWKENPRGDQEGSPKITDATMTSTMNGDVEGEAVSDSLMVYPSETYASFVGLQRVTGRIGDREGSFVLQSAGTWEGGVAKSDWFVVPHSGTGGLAGLKGSGGSTSGASEGGDFTLDYDFD